MPTAPTAQSIKQKLEKGTHVILKGPPGTGKTHLAMETIREFVDDTGAEVSIVRHQMTVYFIANKGKSEGGSFNLSRSNEAKGDLGTENSLYPPAENDAYFQLFAQDTGKSVAVKLFQYDGDELRNIRDSYISTHLEFKNEGSGGSVQLRNVESDWIQQWDLLKLTRRIVAQNDADIFEYHLHRYAPGSQLYDEYTQHFLETEGAPDPKFGFPFTEPPAGYEHLLSLQRKHRTMVMELSAEPFFVNASVVWDIVQFHPTYSYSDFVRGVDPDFSDGQIRFKDQKRTFLNMCESAIKNPETPHVLIVDEINRAALGSVFGELILGLEDEYKGIPILTGSGDRITIPKNLALLGTMNSSDRSIGVIDHALKRRFEWIELPAVLESSANVDEQLLKDLNDLLAPEVREERGFGKWMIGKSGKCASVAFTIIPQLETLLREGELNTGLMSEAAEKIAQWFESQDEKKFGNQIMEFVRQHNPAYELIFDIHETVGHDVESTVFEITLPKTRANPNHPKAYARYDSENKKWTVLKDSGICKESDKFGENNTSDPKIIEDLKEKKIIQLFDDDTGVFLKDWPADSASQAARIPKREQTTDGGRYWKTEDGTSFRDWMKSQEVVNE
tara:strand:+ start:1348 stop:3201 length:1854 start_codon:yes stop_codon:yes gene_type:complete